MASSVFPLSNRTSDEWQALKHAADTVEGIAYDMQEISQEYCVPEDALVDGMAIRDLREAVALIRRNLTE